MSKQQAVRMGVCLAIVKGTVCMRRLRKVKHRQRDSNGKWYTEKLPACPKHGEVFG